jgi:hypothetical protein
MREDPTHPLSGVSPKLGCPLPFMHKCFSFNASVFFVILCKSVFVLCKFSFIYDELTCVNQ